MFLIKLLGMSGQWIDLEPHVQLRISQTALKANLKKEKHPVRQKDNTLTKKEKKKKMNITQMHWAADDR